MIVGEAGFADTLRFCGRSLAEEEGDPTAVELLSMGALSLPAPVCVHNCPVVHLHRQQGCLQLGCADSRVVLSNPQPGRVTPVGSTCVDQKPRHAMFA